MVGESLVNHPMALVAPATPTIPQDPSLTKTGSLASTLSPYNLAVSFKKDLRVAGPFVPPHGGVKGEG